MRYDEEGLEDQELVLQILLGKERDGNPAHLFPSWNLSN